LGILRVCRFNSRRAKKSKPQLNERYGFVINRRRNNYYSWFRSFWCSFNILAAFVSFYLLWWGKDPVWLAFIVALLLIVVQFFARATETSHLLMEHRLDAYSVLGIYRPFSYHCTFAWAIIIIFTACFLVYLTGSILLAQPDTGGLNSFFEEFARALPVKRYTTFMLAILAANELFNLFLDLFGIQSLVVNKQQNKQAT